MRFTPTPEDLTTAYRRQALARLWSWASLISVTVTLLIVGGFLLFVATDIPVPVRWVILGCAAAGGLGVPLFMIRWRIPVMARRIYKQQRALHDEITVGWDAAGLHTRTGMGDARLPWAAYHRWREDTAVILRYQSDLLFQFIPKRVVTAAQVGALRGYAAAAGVRGADRAAR